MKCWEISSFAKDLSKLIQLIDKYELPIEVRKLTNLESQFQYFDSFSIDLEDLVFSISKKISGTVPSDIGAIEIMLTNKFDLDSTKDPNEYDPIINYNFQIQIKGYDEQSNEYVYWWHLDKNIESKKPKFTHPYYHFQAGGDEIETKGTGELLLLGAPRIPHPPMDLFLGIHFIINNFFSTKDYPILLDLFENYDYQEIIKMAQRRMWEPYFNAYFTPNTNNDFTLEKVFPLFIK